MPKPWSSPIDKKNQEPPEVNQMIDDKTTQSTKANKELALLNQINDIILSENDIDELYNKVCSCIVYAGGYKLAWICHKPDDTDKDQVAGPLVAKGVTGHLTGIKIDLSNPALSNGPTGVVLQKGKTVVNNDVSNPEFFTPWEAKAQKNGIHSSIALYLDLGNGKSGALSIYAGKTNAFDAHETLVLERLAANLSIAVRNIKTRMELAQSEIRFRRAFEDAAIGMGLVSLDGKWIKVNRSLHEMLGYTEKELLELTFQQITHPDDLEKDLEFLNQALRGEIDTYRMEKRYFHKNGSIIWINLNVSLVRNPDTSPLYFVSQIENITEKVETQNQFRDLVENFIVGVSIMQDDKFVYVNPHQLEETGYSAEEVINMPFEKFIYKDDLKMVSENVRKRANNKIKSIRYEARLLKKNGQPLWYEILGGTTLFKGAPALIGTMVNIDERKKADEEILRLTRLYRFTSHINESMLKAKNAMDIYSEACRIAVEIGGFRMAWIGAYDQSKDRITPIAWNGYEDGFLKAIDIEGMKVSESAIPLARAIRERSHFYYNDIANDPEIPEPIKREMVKMGYLSGVSLPIFINGQIIAAMVLLMSEPFFFNEDEIKQLRGVTDNITYALDKIRILELQNHSEANLRSIFETTDVCYLLLDTDYNIITLNQHMKDVYMGAANIALKEGMNLLESIAPEKSQNARKIYDMVVRTNQSLDYETSYVNNGIVSHFASNVKPIYDGEKVIGICVSAIDITERKKALELLKVVNGNLQKKARELAISNAELEQFAYVASHDLQEPLRMVTSFLAQLEKKYSDSLDERAKQYIYFAADGAKRMRQLILDLLEFSRVGRTNQLQENVDFNELVSEIQILFRRNIAETKAEIHFKNLPSLQIYKTPVRQIFQNLIGNALKYHKPGIRPIIQIIFTELKDNYQFSVIDNGIGINSDFFDQIFIIFKRLHNRDEYSGTGMGLAITKKIIEHMGGRIWVVSTEGEGSTFHFTMPKHKQ